MSAVSAILWAYTGITTCILIVGLVRAVTARISGRPVKETHIKNDILRRAFQWFVFPSYMVVMLVLAVAEGVRDFVYRIKDWLLVDIVNYWKLYE